MMKLPDVGSFPWWYLATRSAITNNLCLLLSGHIDKQIISPLAGLERDELASETLVKADEFLKSCIAGANDPGNAGEEARFDFFLVSHVLYHQQAKLEIQLDEQDEHGFQKELEFYRQILEKIINYNPDGGFIGNDEVIHLFKFFNALADFIHIQTSVHHRLIMTRGRSK